MSDVRWWVVHEPELLAALEQAAQGDEPGVVLLEMLANATTEEVEATLDAETVVVARAAIEVRAVGLLDTFIAEDAAGALLASNAGRRLDVLHGIRFGAMGAIAEIRALGGDAVGDSDV